MRRLSLRPTFLAITLLVLAAAGSSLAAQTFTATLTNGTEWTSYYRPLISAEDDSKVLLLTTAGNWVELNRSDVVTLDAKVPGGHGAQLMQDGSIRLGRVANDAAEDGSEEAVDPATRLLNYMMQRDANQTDYSVDQFAEPSDAGRGGLPVSGLGVPPGQTVGSGSTSFLVGSGGPEAVEPSETQ